MSTTAVTSAAVLAGTPFVASVLQPGGLGPLLAVEYKRLAVFTRVNFLLNKPFGVVHGVVVCV